MKLAKILRPHIQKKDTKYCLAILVIVRFSCTLFKLIYGSSLHIVRKMFGVDQNIDSSMI